MANDSGAARPVRCLLLFAILEAAVGADPVSAQTTASPASRTAVGDSARPSEPAVAQDTSSLAGLVKDATSEAPVADALVQVLDAGWGTITDDAGRFLLPGLPAGRHRLVIHAQWYQTRELDVRVLSNVRRTIDVDLDPQPIEIGGVVVTARRPSVTPWTTMGGLAGFYDRQKRAGAAYFITPARLETDRRQQITDYLRTMPGVVVECATLATRCVPRVHYRSIQGGSCQMALFVDGLRDATPVDDIPIEWVRAIEVYAHPGSVPLRFGGTNGDCGVIAVWMK